jgi:hypothetical protein
LGGATSFTGLPQVREREVHAAVALDGELFPATRASFASVGTGALRVDPVVS